MSRIRLGATAALVASALALTGCAGGPASGSIADLDPDQKVEIVFESYNLLQAGAWSDTINGLVDDFMAEHPNITVIAQPTQGASTAGSNTVGSVQTQLLAGSPPDVAQLTFDGLDYIVNELGAQNVEALVGSDAVEEHFFGGDYPFHPRAATLGDWDGQTYGMPYVFSTPVLWYNATAFEAAGLSADVDLSTWDAVADAARVLKESTGSAPITISCSVIGGSWCMQGIIRSNGGSVLSEDRTTIEFGEAGAVGAVEMLRGLSDEGLLANLDATSQYEAFANGESLIQLQTSALQGTFMAASAAGGWELRNTTMPAFAGKPVVPTNSGSALFMFSQDPDKQAAAWEFMKFMTSAHAYERITTGIGYLPLRTSLTEGDGPLAEWAASNPLVAPNLLQLDALEPWLSYPGNSYVQVDDLLGTAIEEAVYYGKDPAATLAEAQKRAQALIGE